MPESILASNLIATVDSAVAKATLASDVDHHGLAGSIREVLLADLIVPLLPDGFRAGAGKILDREGRLSPQADIIIYNRARFSPLMFDERQGVFPIDSVYYAIEVKSTVTATEVRDAIAKAEAVRSLKGPCVNFVMFGFRSDLTTPAADLLRIQTYQPGNSHPVVNVYCVVGNGYSYHDGTKWQVCGAVERRAEVIGLLCGITNTLVNDSRRGSDINPGKYLSWWE